MKYDFGFIGCGNMGGALIKALAKTVDVKKIAVCDFFQDKAKAFEKELGVVCSNAEEIAKECEFIVLAVKPQNMSDTLKPLREILKNREDVCLISMAAGLSISAIKEYAGNDFPVIRIMPNTPCTLGAGMVLYCTDKVSKAQETAFLTAFSSAGKIDKIEESKIDAASALSGCGPAFVYMFAEALADGAVECGVPRDKAILYASQTLLGAAEMLLAFGHPGDLKDAVCSPGGTTIAGVHSLEKSGFRNAAMDAVLSAYKRTLELKK